MPKFIFTILLTFFLIHVLSGQDKKIMDKQSRNSVEFRLDSVLGDYKFQHKQSLQVIDSLISDIHETNGLIFKSIELQNAKLEDLEKKITHTDSSAFRDFFYPILLSIIAAIIFWFAFSYYPERSRKKRIRVKLDLEIYQVYTKIFSLFDTVLRKNNHSPSDYQSQIRGGLLNRRDIEIGLQNKCLNETYLYYPEIQNTLLPIGKSLYNSIQKIDRDIDRLFNFSMYLHPDEILLFENIRNKLYTYDLENHERSSISIIGGMQLKPVNPSLSYMANNFNELYELFKQLQKLVFRNKFENRNVFVSKVQYHFYSGQYEETIKVIKNNSHKYSKDENFFDWYVFQSLYKLNKLPESYKLLESLFEKKAHLVSSRSFLKDYLNDKIIQDLLNKYYSVKDLSELDKVIKKEELIEKAFIDSAKSLEEFYAKKIEENSKK